MLLGHAKLASRYMYMLLPLGAMVFVHIKYQEARTKKNLYTHKDAAMILEINTSWPRDFFDERTNNIFGSLIAVLVRSICKVPSY